MSDTYPIIAPRTMKACVGAILAHLESALSTLDWAVGKLRAAPIFVPSASGGGNNSALLRMAGLRTRWEEACCDRLTAAIGVVVPLLDARMFSSTALEAVLKVAAHLYKLMGAIARQAVGGVAKTQGGWLLLGSSGQ